MKSNRDPVQFLTTEIMRELTVRATQSPRLRTHYNYHALDDGYQRMLNVAQPGSYIVPHVHRDPPKSESFVVLTGEITFVCFDDAGEVTLARRLGPARGAVGVDLTPGVWHTFLATKPDTVVFEGKNGPYDPATDKTLAPWAPAEGDPGVGAYMEKLLGQVEPGLPA